jgi:hypothetical protein
MWEGEQRAKDLAHGIYLVATIILFREFTASTDVLNLVLHVE